jgi:hypothetical protein
MPQSTNYPMTSRDHPMSQNTKSTTNVNKKPTTQRRGWKQIDPYRGRTCDLGVISTTL